MKLCKFIGAEGYVAKMSMYIKMQDGGVCVADECAFCSEVSINRFAKTSEREEHVGRLAVHKKCGCNTEVSWAHTTP